VRSLLEELLARDPGFALADVLAALGRRGLLPEPV
jgi:hypothetical protein